MLSLGKFIDYSNCPSRYFFKHIEKLQENKNNSLTTYFNVISLIKKSLMNNLPFEDFSTELESVLLKAEDTWYSFELEKEQAISYLRTQSIRYYQFEKKRNSRVPIESFKANSNITVDSIEYSCPYDIILETKEGIEVIKYKIGKPKLSSAGRSFETRPENSFELVAMYLSICDTCPNAIVSFYYLQNKDDKSYSPIEIFNNKKNKNIVSHKFSKEEALNTFRLHMSKINIPNSIDISDYKPNISSNNCTYCNYTSVCNTLNNLYLEQEQIRMTEKCEALKKRNISFDSFQKDAIENLHGYIRIIAPPGSGKTAILVERYTRLIKEGISPKKILFLSFTKEAVHEIKERTLESIGHLTDSSGMEIYTFHSFCTYLLQNYTDIQWTLFSESKCLSFIKEFLCKNPLENVSYANPFEEYGIIKKLYNIINKSLDTSEPLASLFPEEREDIITWCSGLLKYIIEYKKENNLISYSDMLLFTFELLEKNAEINKKVSSLYEYIMIDEYQDTDTLQAKIIHMLNVPNICVCGDEDQSIYKFRGADISNFIEFKNNYPFCKDILLVNNYRSLTPIVNISQLFIADSKERIENKQAFSTRGCSNTPAVYYYDQCSGYEKHKLFIENMFAKGYKSKDIAILSRKHATLKKVSEFLKNENITCGYLRKDVRDYPSFHTFNAFLDGLFSRNNVLNQNKYLYEFYTGISLNDAVCSLITDSFGKGSTFEDEIQKVFDWCRCVLQVKEFVNKLISESKITNLYSLYQRLLLADFYKESLPVEDLITNEVKLLTAHASKGKEFPVVIITDTNEFDDSFEEEKRILYVAMTRAQNELLLANVVGRKQSKFSDTLKLFEKEVVNVE